MDIRPGDTVFGATEDEKYEVIELINAGSFGLVYKVLDSERNPLALKTISTALLDSAGLQTLTNEGKLATEIRHPNVLTVFFFHAGTRYAHLPPYMLMEYADGGSLDKLLATRRESRELFSIEEIRTMFIQLALGMQAINEKLVHRDLKPDNILIVDGTLNISDFGLSKVIGSATRSSTFKGINHIRYCAPEAWDQLENTPSMDMYSMGMVFYELATLSSPYDVKDPGDPVAAWRNAHMFKVADDPRKHNPDLPLWLAQLVTRMISKRPGDRYSSWDEVLNRVTQNQEAAAVAVDVSSLVKRAVASRQKEEQGRLRAEEKRRKKEEFLHLVAFCFREILSAAREIVDTFNQSSEFAKLRIHKLDDLFFMIEPDRKNGAVVEVQVSPMEQGHKFREKIIKAWGRARSHSGRGFNLILVSSTSEDLYGEWLTLHVRHSSLAPPTDDRPDPFPFEVAELPREIQLLDAIHIYDTDEGPFSADMFKPLIEELL